MFVRTASTRDLPAVRALLIATWHDTYDAIYGSERVDEITDEWHSIPALEARLSRPQSEFLVADDGKQIGGMAFAAVADGGATVELHQLYVLPEFQGRGIGGLLLDEIESCFPEANRVRLDVDDKNLKAIAFYVAQGFVEAGKNTAGAGGAPSVMYERPIVWAD